MDHFIRGDQNRILLPNKCVNTVLIFICEGCHYVVCFGKIGFELEVESVELSGFRGVFRLNCCQLCSWK